MLPNSVFNEAVTSARYMYIQSAPAPWLDLYLCDDDDLYQSCYSSMHAKSFAVQNHDDVMCWHIAHALWTHGGRIATYIHTHIHRYSKFTIIVTLVFGACSGSPRITFACLSIHPSVREGHQKWYVLEKQEAVPSSSWHLEATLDLQL